MAKSTPTVTHEPTGPLTRPRVVQEWLCTGCDEWLHLQWDTDGMDHTYVDFGGRPGIDRSPQGLRDDPKAWWDTLAKNDIAAYSALSAQEALGGRLFWHPHIPGGIPSIVIEPIEVPQCHGWPMRSVRDGWVCRQHPGPLIPYQEA